MIFSLILAGQLALQPNFTFRLDCTKNGVREIQHFIDYNRFAREGDRLIFAKNETLFGQPVETQVIKVIDRGETCTVLRQPVSWPTPLPPLR